MTPQTIARQHYLMAQCAARRLSERVTPGLVRLWFWHMARSGEPK